MMSDAKIPSSMPQRERTRDKIAGALKSSVVFGGSAILSAANAITPHLAGAVDIMVVEQPDGTLKSTPFFVRFGKYSSIRNKERAVKLYVNDELVDFRMHLGSYGHAYLLEPVSDNAPASAGESDPSSSLILGVEVGSMREMGADEEVLLAGMMSPTTEYESSGDEGDEGKQRYARKRNILPGLPDTALGSSPPGSGAKMAGLCEQVTQRLVTAHADVQHVLGSSCESHRSFTSGSGGLQLSTAPVEPSPASCGQLGSYWTGGELRVSSGWSYTSLQAPNLPTQLGFPENAVIAPTASTHSDTVVIVPPSDQVLESVPMSMVHNRGSGIICAPPECERTIERVIPLGVSPTESSSRLYEVGAGIFGPVVGPSSGHGCNASEGLREAEIHSRFASSSSIAFPTASVAWQQSSHTQDGNLQDFQFLQGMDIVCQPRLENQEPSLAGVVNLADAAAVAAGSAFGTAADAAISAVLQGVELSHCGAELSPDVDVVKAHRIFDQLLIRPEDFANHGRELLASLNLMVRVGGNIFPWYAAAPMVVGGLLYGCRWDHLVTPGAPRWGPLPGSQPGAWGPLTPSTEADMRAVEKQKVSGGWSIWPFGSRKERLEEDKLQNQVSEPGGSHSESVRYKRQSAPGPSMPFSGGAFRRSSSPLVSPKHMNKEAAIQTRTVPPASATSAASLEGPSSTSDAGLLQSKDSAYNSNTLKRRKALTPSPEQLASLNLKPGRNRVTYRISNSAELSAYIYLLKWNSKIVISDVDGTITKSDVLGHLLPAMGLDWSQAGISQLFTNVAAHGYQMMYLSSRSIGQANITREYLNTIVQGEHRMPLGPVIISPDGILPSLYREMILRRPHEFKIATLQDIRSLFPLDWNPFYAGFGNRDTDEISYKTVGVPTGRIFIINPKGELHQASVSIQSSALSSLKAINELVGNIFPPLPLDLRMGSPRGVRRVNTVSRCNDAGGCSEDHEREEGLEMQGDEPGPAPSISMASGIIPLDEQYNDLAYWKVDAAPDAAAALMERYLSRESLFVIDKRDSKQGDMSSGESCEQRRDGGVAPGKGGIISQTMGRTSSDFITSYNPFVL
ncbi:hypothetical protein CEUSTIGMA_g8765.t1 [Chlamydomonas eustigma]|uniref:LNS2/PITP domain-containing protein n=1 Tax=Chlamydomonas eustigma TaxID=1157962 RepID=A0A250XE35_9CHLO|nr:hypothetical protein CEUSTIGMA_g8765.t1 [Chlamydomonas eustigma]|eukprot:GAX81334.1 hypothetical protein CEUSTIGMA_g8765.t1 [Chlamydomonas eustigma]